MASDDSIGDTGSVSRDAASAQLGEVEGARAEPYQVPRLFVAGSAAELVRGSLVNAQYKDSANDWYDAWPKGPNNPN